MKKFIALVICVFLAASAFVACAAEPVAAEEPAAEDTAADDSAAEEPVEAEESADEAEPAAEASSLDIGFYADGADIYYQIAYEALTGLAESDAECDWTVSQKIGQNTAPEQIQAVQDFITAGCDAVVVIQNSVDATAECISMCSDAGIPYFGIAHDFSSAENALDAAGGVCFDFIDIGYDTGVNAFESGVTRLVNIEGQLGQGSAGAQTLGLLQGFEAMGADLGGYTALEIAEQKFDHDSYNGEQTFEIVFWASGGWFEDPSYKAMTDAVTALGADGFDGIYAHNNPMMDGCINALKDAGLDPADYWIGSCNGRESTREMVKEGTVTCDVNEPASLEGAAIYQMLKAYFAGEEYEKFVHPVAVVYTKDNIQEIEDTLVPFSSAEEFLAMVEDGGVDISLDGPMYVVNENYR